MNKKRLDLLLVEKQLVKSRSQAIDLIKHGKVRIDGVQVTKPSTSVSIEANIEVEKDNLFVSRGGQKLEHALKEFGVSAKDKICLDIGSSTGGFTDCLIKYGAKKVYAVDVGSDQFDKELSKNPKVILFEKTDIRNLNLPAQVNLSVIDVSFISLSIVLPEALRLTLKKSDIIALIKPQFEVGKENLPKTGVVINPEDHNLAIEKIKKAGESIGLDFQSVIKSPIAGGSGNQEFLIHFKTP